jgi:hypothetical protein
MESITIEKVPKNFIKQYWKTISYDFFMQNIIWKKEEIIYWNDEEIKNIGKSSSIFSNSF